MDKRISVLVIKTRAGISLVEWKQEGKTVRGSIPQDSIDADGTVSIETLGNATLYGLDFSGLSLPGAMEFENELHNAGIWTAEDVLHDRPALLRALDALKPALLRAIVDYAKDGGNDG